MDRCPHGFFVACLLSAFAWALTLSGCAKGCPNGSGLLNGRCVPVQQPGGTGPTAEQQLADTANGASGQAAPPARTSQSDAGEPAVNPPRPSAGAAGSAGRGTQRAAPADNSNRASDPACAPSEELCDNMDNDCDGKVDEEVTRACQDLPSPCQAGVLSCHAGKWDDEATQCVGAIGPTEEICDDAMLDENCNGTANEGCACNENETQPCGRSDGVCKPGVQRCSGGMWTMECEGAVGNPDEGCECLSGMTESCNAGRGVCAMGERQCEKGMWTACKSLEKSSQELCDNLDNDCNGIVDGPTAKCDRPNERCVGLGVCAECVTDVDCGKMTTGCNVGKCNSGTCAAEPLEQYARCTSGSTSGYCVENKCTPPRQYQIDDTDAEVKYSRSWPVAGTVHYSNTAGDYYLVHFVGTKAALYGGKGPDRGQAEYSICDASGSGCTSVHPQSNYAAMLSVELLWTTPTVPFGEHTLKARVTGISAGATDTIVDIDYVRVN